MCRQFRLTPDPRLPDRLTLPSLGSFDGRVVARLPFEPISFVRGLSHRNLAGEDFRECSFIFLYILCTMSIRQVRLTRWSEGRKDLMDEELNEELSEDLASAREG